MIIALQEVGAPAQKEITFELDPKSKTCDLEFSWDNEWRVIASGAKPKKVKRVKYQA